MDMDLFSMEKGWDMKIKKLWPILAGILGAILGFWIIKKRRR